MDRSLAYIKGKFSIPQILHSKGPIFFIVLACLIYLLVYAGLVFFKIQYPVYFYEYSLGYSAWLWGGWTINVIVYICIFFKPDFNFLLIMSNTRKNIFGSQTAYTIIISSILAIIATLDLELVMFINRYFEFKEWTLMTFLYKTAAPNFSMQVFLFFAYYLSVSMFAFFMATLAYRYGRMFHILFWGFIIAVTCVILPILLWFFGLYTPIYQFLSWALGFGKGSGMLIGAGNLMILAVIFGMATYFGMRRLPLKM